MNTQRNLIPIPSPFQLAIILTLFSLCMSIVKVSSTGASLIASTHTSLRFWYEGIWEPGLMRFLVQMVLMLLLGHLIALSKPIQNSMQFVLSLVRSQNSGVVLLALFSVLSCWLNWGLGLVASALLSHQMVVHFSRRGIPCSPGLLAAVSYVGMMVWHGGISGSATLKAAEAGHIQSLMRSVDWPDQIPVSETIFSSLNLFVLGVQILCIPLFCWFLSKYSTSDVKSCTEFEVPENTTEETSRLSFLPLIGACGIVVWGLWSFSWSKSFFESIGPDSINFVLLCCCFLAYRNSEELLAKAQRAVKSTSSVLLLFPLYFGIMGLIHSSGLGEDVVLFFKQYSTPESLPQWILVSSGLVNILVPSGGGQWAIQGPLVLEIASDMGVSLPKAILALSYGDQLTNMLQPFWALPLLGITGLKAKDIFSYTMQFFLLGWAIYAFALWLF